MLGYAVDVLNRSMFQPPMLSSRNSIHKINIDVCNICAAAKISVSDAQTVSLSIHLQSFQILGH